VAGVLGANGANVLKPVALDRNIEHGPVPDPLQHMVENHVWDWANRLGGVTRGTALVRILIAYFLGVKEK